MRRACKAAHNPSCEPDVYCPNAAGWTSGRQEERVMTKTAFMGSLALVLLSGAVGAQEKAPPADAPQQDQVTQDERATDPRPQIRVLENPYDLASYYHSSQGG